MVHSGDLALKPQSSLQRKRAFSMMENELGDDGGTDPLQKNIYMYRDVGTANNNLQYSIRQ